MDQVVMVLDEPPYEQAKHGAEGAAGFRNIGLSGFGRIQFQGKFHTQAERAGFVISR